MLQAILAGLLTLAAIAVVVVIVMRRKGLGGMRKNDEHVVKEHSLNAIDTVVTANPHQSGGFGPGGGSVQVPRSKTASGSPGEMLRGRFVAMGVFAAAVFGSLGVKLWSMQIMQGASYATKATANLYTTVYTPAPRGIIYDADGVALVRNRSSFTVLADSSVADNRDVVLRLSALLGIPYEVVRQRILDTSTGAQNTRVVDSGISLRNMAFISEHIDAFSGVTCETRTVRDYPYGALAAHALGYTGTASDTDLSSIGEGRDLQSGDVVGKSGVEATYEDLLAGDHGTRTLLTDADGTVVKVASETDPTRGNDVYLSVVAAVQKVADQALHDQIAPGGKLGSNKGTAGALVCIDVRDGGITALSNFPTYAPSSFIGGIGQDVWDAFNTEKSHYPLMDRVVSGAYPPASTYKAFSAMAALQKGVATKDSSYDCTGTWDGFGSAYAQKCWKTSGHGELDLVGGIANSCDVVFYEIAKGFFNQQSTLGANALQDQIQEYGFGHQLGIDLSGEVSGRVPTAQWKAEYYKDAPEQATWMGGDMTNMIIGQGYALATPLQIACGYAGIATGKVYRPHLLKEVRNSLGETVLSAKQEVIYEPEMSEGNIKLVREGLEQVMTLNGYTSKFFNGSYTVAGKTGTAEVAGKNDYAWFVGYAPADNPKYVCACLIEEGISPAESALPVVGQVLDAMMAYDAGTLDKTMASISAAYETVETSEPTGTTSTSRSD